MADPDGRGSTDGHVASPRAVFPPLRLTLEGVAVIYLAIPNLIFLLSWATPIVGIPIFVVLMLAIGRILSSVPESDRSTGFHGKTVLTVVILVAVGWTAFGGAGHLGYANSDWLLRDALYGDLIRYSWPIAYQMPDGSPGVLRTAMGYFLAPALLAHVVGVGFADILLFAWTAAGVAIFLAMLPVPRGRGPIGWLVPLLVAVIFSGMDALAIWIYDGQQWPEFPAHLEWWTIRFQYSAFSTQLFWVPNHAIAAWIASALFFRVRRETGKVEVCALALALLPLWSPFAALGFAPFAAVAAIRSWRQEHRLGISATVMIAVVTLIAAIGAVLMSGAGDMVGQLPLGTALLIGKIENAIPEFLSIYLLFVMMEFGFLAIALCMLLDREREFLWIAAGILLALPFIRFGPGNDVVMRASIPALTMLCLLVVVAATEPVAVSKGALAASALLAACVTLGSITALYEMGRTVVNARWDANYELTMRESQRGMLPQHYVGSLDGSIAKWVIRKPVALH